MTAAIVADLTRVIEATTRRIRERTVKVIAAWLEKRMANAFRAQGRRFARHFERRLKKSWPSPVAEAIAAVTAASSLGCGRLGQGQGWAALKESIADDLELALAAAERETLGAFVNPIQAAAGKAMATGANVLIAELDLAGSFSLKNPRAVAYLKAHGAELVAGINEATRESIRAIVTQAVDEGWSYNRTAQAISSRFREFAVGRPQDHIDSRAHLVAITESGNAYMAGQAAVVGDLADSGLKMEKSWATIGDGKVSEGCQENEAAGWIAAADTFPSGDMHPLRFPGCRCDVRYRHAPKEN